MVRAEPDLRLDEAARRFGRDSRRHLRNQSSAISPNVEGQLMFVMLYSRCLSLSCRPSIALSYAILAMGLNRHVKAGLGRGSNLSSLLLTLHREKRHKPSPRDALFLR
jgi:hypothetical protein